MKIGFLNTKYFKHILNNIEDILLEARSPKLRRDVAEGRREYAQGKSKSLADVLSSLQHN